LSSTTNFIAELVRAANMLEKIGESEKRRLLDRAWRTIREGREQTGLKPSRTKADHAMDFLSMSRSLELYSDDEIKGALLEAADMVRTLKIMLDAKDEVSGGGNTH
jgi:hypothetical protein